MADDRELVQKALERAAREREYPLLQIPAYQAWSKRKLEAGESDALIAHLDATSMCLLPEEVDALTDGDFDEWLEELRSSLEKEERDR
jgi:hypothetical protein